MEAPGPSYDAPDPAGAEDDYDDDDDEVVAEAEVPTAEGEVATGDPPPPKKRGGHGRRKIEIEYIKDKIRRHITFSKRKAGISKKAYELSRLTGAQVLLLISSERGQIYSFATPKLQPILTNDESKGLIEQCLNDPEPPLALEHQGYAEGEAAAYAEGDPQQYPEATAAAADPAQGFDPMAGDTAHMMGHEAPLAQAHLVPVPTMAPTQPNAELAVPEAHLVQASAVAAEI